MSYTQHTMLSIDLPKKLHRQLLGLFGVKYSKKKPQITNSIKENKTTAKKIPTEAEFKAIKLVDAKTNYNYTIKSLGNASNYEDEYDSTKQDNPQYYDLNKLLEKKPFCSNLFKNFVNNKNIEIVEPIVHTNNYNDIKLKPYWKKCPYFKERLNHYFTYVKGNLVFPVDKDYEERGNERYTDSPYFAHFNYQLYDIDFDNNPKNGKQSLFYSGGFYNREESEIDRKASDQDVYTMLDFNTCKVIRIQSVNNILDFYTLKSNGNYNGVINYDGKYYIFDLWGKYYPNDNSKFISFYVWGNKFIGKLVGYRDIIFEKCTYYNKKENK